MLNENIKNILPLTSKVNKEGTLEIGGCNLEELSNQYGTPLYLYDETTIRQICKEFVNEFENSYPDSHISYSSKAFSSPYLTKILEEENLGIDVVSGGELSVLQHAEFPSSRVNFHGNNKSYEELKQAVEWKIETITLDSFDEITLLNQIASELSIKQKVLIRVSPSVDPKTHILTTTGNLDSKFGFPIETGQAEEAIKLTVKMSNLELHGIHFHLGSPIFETKPYVLAINYVLEFANQQKKNGLNLRIFNPGGGFAVSYTSTDKIPPSIKEYANSISKTIKNKCNELSLPEPHLIVEPGRAIVARSGVAIYKVGSIKDIPGVRKYVSIDGGMGDNIRPALYQSKYSLFSVTKILNKPTEKVAVVGKFCESGDILSSETYLPKLKYGDLILAATSGAYNIPMSSNYNMYCRPTILIVNQGNHRIIKKRETYEDLLSHFV